MKDVHASLQEPRYVMYLAVLPFYRQACIESLRELLGESLALYAGQEHTDPTVRTGINPSYYTPVSNRFLFRRKAMLQVGHWRDALRAETVIVDLNPRNLTSWIMTVGRKLARRRTLVWGHLYPRKGPGASTDGLRRLLRRLSDGTVLYGYDMVAPARSDLPRQSVWVAPNALYRGADLSTTANATSRTSIIYVGRLVGSKKVAVLLEAFALTACRADGATLSIVGAGEESAALLELARRLGCQESIRFSGEITNLQIIRDLYADAFVSISPGYAGLSLTQSLGFGVPVIVSRNEPHSPEIELHRFGNVSYFATDNADDLAKMIDEAWAKRAVILNEAVAEPIKRLYSAETMAKGLAAAFRNTFAPRSPEEASVWTHR